MNKSLYMECSSGISGDMTVAALLDLGADKKVLAESLASLNIDGYRIEISKVNKQGIEASDFNVILENGDGQDHHEVHIHRNIYDIYAIIDRLKGSERVKKMSKKMFYIVAQAESKAHGLPLDKIHFHEVGAVDSIVDIISTAVCMDNLGITDVIVPSISEGTGFVKCQHGLLPVPVPAVVNIACAHQLDLKITDAPGEMVTPTGAAIVAAYRKKNRLPELFKIERTGIGAGKRQYDRPNILRIMIISQEQVCN